MKRPLLIALFFISCLLVHAQDSIIKRDGSHIVAKILEVSAMQVKYKKFDFQDGPTFIDNRSDIKTIVYSNGVRDEFQQAIINTDPSTSDYYSGSAKNSINGNTIEQYGTRYSYNNHIINERELNTLLFQSKDKNIISLAGSSKDAKKMEYIGFAAFPLGIASLVFFTESIIHPTYKANSQPQLNKKYLTFSGICLVGTIACPIVSGIYRNKSTTYKKAAIKLYNEKF